MQPKPKITKDMVVDAAFTLARETGAENKSHLKETYRGTISAVQEETK